MVLWSKDNFTTCNDVDLQRRLSYDKISIVVDISLYGSLILLP